LSKLHIFKRQVFLMELWHLSFAAIFPGRNYGKVIVVPLGFAVGGLVFFSEVAIAGFFPLQGIPCHQFGQVDKVRHSSGKFEVFVDVFVRCLPSFPWLTIKFMRLEIDVGVDRYAHQQGLF
jgi:hypothetical protein